MNAGRLERWEASIGLSLSRANHARGKHGRMSVPKMVLWCLRHPPATLTGAKYINVQSSI
jgi:hypothetical protein